MKKRLLLIVGLLLALLMVTGCGKQVEEVDETMVQNKSQLLLNILESSDISTLEEFKNSSDFLKDYQLASMTQTDASGNQVSLNDTKTDDFEGIIDAWIAAVNEMGDFVSADDEFKIEQKGTTTTATLNCKFENRDAEMVINFDSEKCRMENMVVNGDYTTGEVMKKAALNTLMGIGTVFIVLIIIALIISLFKFLPGNEQTKSEKEAAPKAAPAKVASSKPAGDDAEIQAVIAAAIAAYSAETGQDSSGYVVKKIVRRGRR